MRCPLHELHQAAPKRCNHPVKLIVCQNPISSGIVDHTAGVSLLTPGGSQCLLSALEASDCWSQECQRGSGRCVNELRARRQRLAGSTIVYHSIRGACKAFAGGPVGENRRALKGAPRAPHLRPSRSDRVRQRPLVIAHVTWICSLSHAWSLLSPGQSSLQTLAPPSPLSNLRHMCYTPPVTRFDQGIGWPDAIIKRRQNVDNH